MSRRSFLCRGVALLAMPVTTIAQRPARVYRIGILETIPAAKNTANLDALRRGLRSFGYVEGKNLVIEYRSTNGRAEEFQDLASELVRLNVDVMVTRGTPATRAARNATRTTPVVMATMSNPNAPRGGLEAPAENITGVTTFSTELVGKRIEILREVAPGLTRVGLIHNMSNPASAPEWEEVKAAARSLGLQADLLDVRTLDDLGAVFDAAARRRVDALVIGFDGLTQMHQGTIVASVAKSRLPAVYPSREFVEAGGLLAYGVVYPELYFRFAAMIDKIFKGAKPADLPVEQPTKFELVINLKTANALGIVIPQSVLVRANEIVR